MNSKTYHLKEKNLKVLQRVCTSLLGFQPLWTPVTKYYK